MAGALAVHVAQLSNGHICLKTYEPCCYQNCTTYTGIARFISEYRACPSRAKEEAR